MNINEQVYNVFNSDGKLCQVEYALEKVYNSYQIVSLLSDSEIIAISKKVPQQPLKEESHTSIYKIGENIYVNVTGNPPDIDYFIDKCKSIYSDKEYAFGCPLSPDIFVRYLADKLQVMIQKTGTRAPAFAALVMGFLNGKPMMYYIDNSAVEFPCFAMAAGEDHNKMTKHLEKHYKPTGASSAVQMGISTLLQSIGRDAEATEIEVAVLSPTGIEYYSDEKIGEAIQVIQGNN